MPEWKQEIRQRLAGLKLEPPREAEITEELSQHLEDRYRELIASGVSDDQAFRVVLAELNDTPLLANELHRVERLVRQEPVVLGSNRRSNMLGGVWQDLRYAVRVLLKHKGFTAVAVLSLALGIGANTAIFSLIDALLLKSLPVKNPQQLVFFSIVRPGGTDVTFSYPLVERFKEANHSFAGIIAYWPGEKLRMSVVEPGASSEIEPVQAEQVSGNYFSLLGVNAAAGRTLTESDEQASDPQPVAVLSYDFWQRRFGADSRIIGGKSRLAARDGAATARGEHGASAGGDGRDPSSATRRDACRTSRPTDADRAE